MVFLGKRKKQDMLQLSEELESLKLDQFKNHVNANVKDNLLDNRANLKSATQIAGPLDNYENVRKVNSIPTDKMGRNDESLTTSGNKEKENRFGKASLKSVFFPPENTRERTFERRVIKKCCHCSMPRHIKAGCPDLIKNQEIESLNHIKMNENSKFLNAYITKSYVNGKQIDILRDTGVTRDL
ncbi:hypothetical protein TNIN_101351 [Trichonephila inaurata madagascariensis]|uniref:Uncharacterized protein n=1 Tax=Trichonephila inaurata madagascariensis TaxID=2747483 RepID=A0A8X7CCK2_9ARAC|nr:hypothetical protein TNIN_101351 [Trichonephila inaurata madagascariensis]